MTTESGEGLNLLPQLAILALGPIFAVGLINRVKALWAGRKGPRLNQFFFDLLRLFRKTPVYGDMSSWIFRLAPWVVLSTSAVAALICPMVPGYSPVSFPYDFIYFAYLLGLGRIFVILGALDTGSSFEGMGASREAGYSAFTEPALFFAVGTLGLLTGKTSFHDLVQLGSDGGALWVMRLCILVALFVLLQIEGARIPVDDPNTHLELTMIHEVMILDNSGPELAAVQLGSAVKLVSIAGLIAAILNPFSLSQSPGASWGASLALLVLVAIVIGLVESWIPRFRLRAIPAYAFLGISAAVVSLVFSWAVSAP